MLALRVGSNGKQKITAGRRSVCSPMLCGRPKWLPSRSLWRRGATAAAAAN